MAEENKAKIPPKYNLNAKWDACLDLGVCQFVYSSFSGTFAGLLLFRSPVTRLGPVTRLASVAFGVGLGIGFAYMKCSQKFDGTSPKLTPNIPDAPVSEAEQN